MNIPTLTTRRLTLRPFRLADASEVQRLAGDRAVADMIIGLPHPYADGVAEAWIENHEVRAEKGLEIVWAVERTEDGVLLGSMTLHLVRDHGRAEIGYWVGKPYWGNGYCSEAARCALDHGFAELRLDRIWARCFTRNAASAKVIEKLGMQPEGTLRQHIRRWGVLEDLQYFGLLRAKWSARNTAPDSV